MSLQNLHINSPKLSSVDISYSACVSMLVNWYGCSDFHEQNCWKDPLAGGAASVTSCFPCTTGMSSYLCRFSSGTPPWVAETADMGKSVQLHTKRISLRTTFWAVPQARYMFYAKLLVCKYSYLLNKSIVSQQFSCFHDTDYSSLKIHFPVFIYSTSGLLHLLQHTNSKRLTNNSENVQFNGFVIMLIPGTQSWSYIFKLGILLYCSELQAIVALAWGQLLLYCSWKLSNLYQY